MELDEQCKTCGFLGACFNNACPLQKIDYTDKKIKLKPNNKSCPYEKIILKDLLVLLDRDEGFYNLTSV